MAIKSKFIIFEDLTTFKSDNGIGETPVLNNGYYGNIPEGAVVFIKDTGLIWFNNRYFGPNLKDYLNDYYTKIQVNTKLDKKLDDYSKHYLTFTALSSCTFTFSTNALQYSLDDGQTWTTLAANTASPTVTAGNKILWKQTELTPNSSYGIGTFSATGNFNVSGNIMSLYYGDNFIGQKDLTDKNYAFKNLFNGNTKLVNAENLILSATTLANYCYYYMFRNCTSLTTAPKLPATTLAQYCYSNMFYLCTSLTKAPELPATTLENYCYQDMFYGCASLTKAPEILPATRLTDYCYQYMFYNCTSLTTTPELPATILKQSCYDGMFANCTSLTTATQLPAKTLVFNCYNGMFIGCSKLTIAPQLPATNLVTNCYNSMFFGCTKLNSITCLATNISAGNCTYNWLSYVASIGTFVKADSMTSWTTGTSGIPSGWNVYTESEWKEVKHYELNNYYTKTQVDTKLDKKLDDYSKLYLTFTALESGTFTFSTNALQYSLDNGEHWETLAANTASPTVTAGNKILWKQTELTPTSSAGIGTFSATGNFEVSGNIMSLYYGDNFIGQKDLTGKDYAFYKLFKSNIKLVNVENLILPATTLANNCYDSMFYGCTSLITAPETLPATQLATYCYAFMFRGCTLLTTTPELLATQLANYCYQYMFYGCTSLITAPETLPATQLATYCYQYMFYNCTSLRTAPELPATQLATYCYSSMFYNCTSLRTAPELPATQLATFCYQYMFQNCTSLTIAPKLPATTLAAYCYTSMFSGCTALTTAPELPAPTSIAICYQHMFSGCTKLNYIKCLATDISAINCIAEWVRGVAATGTFVKAESMTSWTTGTSGIPSGWNVYTESEWEEVRHYELNNYYTKTQVNTKLDEKLDDYSKQYLTFTVLESGTFKFTRNALQYSLDGGITWTTLASNTDSPTITAGSKIIWKQSNLNPQQYYGIGTFSSTGRFEASGNIMSLLHGDNFIGQTDLTGKDYAFQDLFSYCSKLINAENLILPSTTLSQYCYYNMFYRCTSLTTAPELPATTLVGDCYIYMFSGCTALITAPELPATTLADFCYNNMFANCTSLTTAPELPATTLANSCYALMFSNCTSLTVAPELYATTLAQYCYSGMFSGCTSLTTLPKTLPATTLAQYCYRSMFNGCTSLITAPELPATTLASYCYLSMFQDCTSLKIAPELSATTLSSGCYYLMFSGCTSLNYIKCLATNISARLCTYNWVQNVSSTGTFVQADNMSSWTNDNSGIPTGWNVYTEAEYNEMRPYKHLVSTVKSSFNVTDTSSSRQSGRSYPVSLDSQYKLMVYVPWIDYNLESSTLNITANHIDGLWDLNGTGGNKSVEYSLNPYSNKQETASFYTEATNPTLSTRLNYDGYFYATKLYSGGNEVAYKLKLNNTDYSSSNGVITVSLPNLLNAIGTLPTSNGGTGNTSYTANRLLYTSSTTQFASTTFFSDGNYITFETSSSANDTTKGINFGTVAHIGASGALGIYSIGDITLRPNQTSLGTITDYSLIINKDHLTYNGNEVATLNWVTNQEYLTSLSLSNYVTLSTEQTISGAKTFTHAGGFTYSGIGVGSANIARPIWFGNANSENNTYVVLVGTPVYNSSFTYNPSNQVLSGAKIAYTQLTGSTTTANQAIVSSGTANGWSLKTLGSNAFNSTAYLPLSGGTMTGAITMNAGTGIAMNYTGRQAQTDEAEGDPWIYTNGYDSYGIRYFEGEPDIITFSASGNNKLKTNADFAIKGDGTLYNKGKIIATQTWVTNQNYVTENNKVTQESSDSIKWRGVILGYNSNNSSNTSIDTSITNIVYTTNNLTVLPSTGSISSLGDITGKDIKANNGFLKSTNNGNTISIGSRNVSWMHVEVDSNIPFYFNLPIYLNGNFIPYTNNSKDLGASDRLWKDLYLYGNLNNGQHALSVDNLYSVYSWYNTITLDDADDLINKWYEITSFLNGISDESELNSILSTFVTKATNQEITGIKRFVTSVLDTNTLQYVKKPLKISRQNLDSENVDIYVDDTTYYHKYYNDEYSSSIVFEMNNSNIEQGSLLSLHASSQHTFKITSSDAGMDAYIDNKIILNSGNTYASSANAIELAWNVEKTIAKINGTEIKIKLPSNPNTNTWRGIYASGESKIGNGVDTKAINYVAGDGISIGFLAAGTSTGQSGSSKYFNVVITNSGVRSIGFLNNDLIVNKNGTDQLSFTIPFATNSTNATNATNATCLVNQSVNNVNNAYDNQKLKWYSSILSTNSGNTGYAGTNIGFPVQNNANGLLWLGTHPVSNSDSTKPYGGQLGVSSNGRLYYRFIMTSFPTSDNGGSWNKIAWTSDIPTVTNYYWANINISSSSNSATEPTFANAYATHSDGTNSAFEATNSRGSVSILASTNRGLYDSTKNTWIVGTDGTDTWLSQGNVGIGTNTPSQKLEVNGNVKANQFKKTDGTSSQFLKADGSVDSNTYATQTWVNNQKYVTVDTDLDITGVKTFKANTNFNEKIVINPLNSTYGTNPISLFWDDTTNKLTIVGTIKKNNQDTNINFLHSGNSSVSLSGQTLTVKINGTSLSLTNTNTWNKVTTSQDGYVIKPSNAQTTALTSNDIPYVLAWRSNISGAVEPAWFKLPDNAYKDTTYTAGSGLTLNNNSFSVSITTLPSKWTSDSTNTDYPIGFCSSNSPVSNNSYNNYYNSDFKYNPYTKSLSGISEIKISNGSHYGILSSSSSTNNNNWTLPNSGGTIALTSDFSLSNSSNGFTTITIKGTSAKLMTDGCLSITKNLKVTSDWMDTGIKTDPTTFPDGGGTYAVLIDFGGTTGSEYGYLKYYSGIMSVYTDKTDSTLSEEVLLHNAGHAWSNRLYLRTTRTSGSTDYTNILIAAQVTFTNAANITFKFKKLI